MSSAGSGSCSDAAQAPHRRRDVAAGPGRSDVAPRVTPEFTAAARAHDPGLDDATLARGRQAFVLNCASCHALPDPRATPAGEWPEVMRVMGPKSHLDAAAGREVLRYALAVRAQAP